MAQKKKKFQYIDDMDEFMALARDRHDLDVAADAEDRAEAEDDQKFAAGEQWNERARAAREKAKRPVITWNRIPTFTAQVVNDGRQNKPAIRTSPLDGGTAETSEFYQARIRQVEYESDADIAYDSAREQQINTGRGHIRITTEYKVGKTADQQILLQPIENQFSVVWDAGSRKYDKTDAEHCFVFTWVSEDEYKRRFGERTKMASSNFFASGANPAPSWVGVGANGDFIQVAEYWVKHHTKRKLYILPDLSVAWEEDLPEDFDKTLLLGDVEKDEVTVCQYIIDGVEVLDETEFPVPFIPIVPVYGRQMMVKGKMRNYSLIRFAKDPQRLVNLYVSNIAEQIAMLPKTPYVGAVGQFLGREKEWAEINENPKAFIQYNIKDVNGVAIPPPQRVVNEPPIQALTIGLEQSIDAIKAAMGIYDASLGAQSNETSGVAIQRRKVQSNTTNFHFADNESRSRKTVGRILLALIRAIDQGPRTVPTRTEDGKVKLVKVNQPHQDPKTGEMVHHDLNVGDYDVAVSTGPSHQSQREEAYDIYSQIAQGDPTFMSKAGDLLFRNLDAPGSDQIADRYEAMLPPGLKPESDAGNQKKQFEQQAQALQALAAQHEQLMGTVHHLSQLVETKQMELDSRERIAMIQGIVTLKSALIKTSSSEEIGKAEREADRLESLFERSHNAALATTAHAMTAARMADQQQQQPPQQQPLPQAA